MRYLGHRGGTGQPPSWRPLNDSVAASLRLGAVWGVFGNGDGIIGTRRIQNRLRYANNMLAPARRGTAIYSGAQFGATRYTNDYQGNQAVTGIEGAAQATFVFLVKENPGTAGYYNSSAPLTVVCSNNSNITITNQWPSGDGYAHSLTFTFQYVWTPTRTKLSLPSGFDGVAIATWDGSAFACYLDGVSNSHTDTISSTVTLPPTETLYVQSIYAGAWGGAQYARQSGQLAYVCGKLFSAADIASISRNPWQVFA